MGEAFIVRRGGGTGKAFAAISVTYPVGSVCTCSNGQKTLKAKDTSGSFLFLVPSGGEWTVSCTNGEKTASKQINVEPNGGYHVKLAYDRNFIRDNVWFMPSNFKKTGGQSGGYKYDMTNGIYIGDNNQKGNMVLTEPLDLRDFRYLHVRAGVTYRYNNNGAVELKTSVDGSAVLNWQTPVTAVGKYNWNTFDINSFDEIYFGLFWWNGYFSVSDIYASNDPEPWSDAT